MADVNSVQSGLWSSGSTWDTSTPPSDGQSVYIGTSHEIEFDADQSAFTTGNSVWMDTGAVFRVSQTAGSYHFTGSIGGQGAIEAGSQGTPLPSNVSMVFEVIGNAIGGTDLGVQVYCTEPVIKFARLTQNAIAGATTLYVDEDLTTDSVWQAGDDVVLAQYDRAKIHEQKTIASIASGQLTLTAGLGNAMPAGSVVALATRNVTFTAPSFQNALSYSLRDGAYIRAAVIDTAGGFGWDHEDLTLEGVCVDVTGTVIIDSRRCTVNAVVIGCDSAIGYTEGGVLGPDGIVAACSSAVYLSQGIRVQCDVFGVDNGLHQSVGLTLENDAKISKVISIGVSQCPGFRMLDGTVIEDCHYGFHTAANIFVEGDVDDCDTGMVWSSGVFKGTISDCDHAVHGCNLSFIHATFSDNANEDLEYVFNATLEGCTFTYQYTPYAMQPADIVTSRDHGGVTGAFKAWCKGGEVEDVGTPVYGSRPRSYRLDCQDTDNPVFYQKRVVVLPGASLHVIAYVRKDTSMAYLPRVQVVDATGDPLVTGAAALAEAVMANSVDTWEKLVLTWQNTGDNPVKVFVRHLAKNGSGYVYFDSEVRSTVALLSFGG